MFILLSVKLFGCSGIPYIYGQLEGVVVLAITMTYIYYICDFCKKTVFALYLLCVIIHLVP